MGSGSRSPVTTLGAGAAATGGAATTAGLKMVKLVIICNSEKPPCIVAPCIVLSLVCYVITLLYVSIEGGSPCYKWMIWNQSWGDHRMYLWLSRWFHTEVHSRNLQHTKLNYTNKIYCTHHNHTQKGATGLQSHLWQRGREMGYCSHMGSTMVGD